MAVLNEAWLHVPAHQRSEFLSTAWPLLLFAAVGAVLGFLAALGIDLSGSIYATLT